MVNISLPRFDIDKVCSVDSRSIQYELQEDNLYTIVKDYRTISGYSLYINNNGVSYKPTQSGIQYFNYLDLCINGVLTGDTEDGSGFFPLNPRNYSIQAVNNNTCAGKTITVTVEPDMISQVWYQNEFNTDLKIVSNVSITLYDKSGKVVVAKSALQTVPTNKSNNTLKPVSLIRTGGEFQNDHSIPTILLGLGLIGFGLFLKFRTKN